MPKMNLDRHVPHSPARMFDLVADLESYPRFVPNCAAMTVRPDPVDPNVRLGRMTLRFGPVSQAYTSRVELDRDAMSIAATAVDGPFHHLDSLWRFEPEGQGTAISFTIDFRFSNGLIAALAEPVFTSKQDEILDAFLREADRRYRSSLPAA